MTTLVKPRAVTLYLVGQDSCTRKWTLLSECMSKDSDNLFDFWDGLSPGDYLNIDLKYSDLDNIKDINKYMDFLNTPISNDKQKLIDHVKQHALSNYDCNGWDILVETMSDKTIESVIGKATTKAGAVLKFSLAGQGRQV